MPGQYFDLNSVIRFRTATLFNQDVSQWNVGASDNFNNMFRNTALNQNLCDWGYNGHLSGSDSFSLAFAGTNCAITAEPNLTATPISPLCHYCNSFETKADLEAAIDHWVDVGPPSVRITLCCFNCQCICGMDFSPSLCPTVQQNYGPIGEWDTSLITDFEQLFRLQSTFNDDISMWNTSSGVCTVAILLSEVWPGFLQSLTITKPLLISDHYADDLLKCPSIQPTS